MNENYNAEMQKLYNELIKAKSDDDKTSKLPIICPATFLNPCRLCDLAKNILFKKGNEGTPIRTKATDLNRKKSYYSNVILPTNPSEIVVFQYGDTIWRELLLFQMSPTSEIKDFLDPKSGRNIIITKTMGATKRQTKYSVKPRISPTPLLDMTVLRRLSEDQYQLHNIIDLLKNGVVKPFYQSQLQERENELRFLPSWLGPGVTKFFQMVLYHYGITEDEFELVQKGEYNPFAGESDTPEEATKGTNKVVIPYVGPLPGAVKEAKSPWDEYAAPDATPISTLIPKKVEEKKEEAYPPCFGKKFSETDTECVEDCAKDGWTEACRTATEALQRSNLEQRKTAKRLVK